MKIPYALIACLALAGCSPSGTPKSQSVKQLNLYLQADPLSLNPRDGFRRRDIQVIRELFEGLVRIGKDGAPELALASSYTLSEDKTVYTFHLRPSKWSNDMAVTANDFVYAWKTTLNGPKVSSGAYVLFNIKNARKANLNQCSVDEIGVRALDPLTLEITLEHPAPYFFEFLALPIFSPVCQAVEEKNSSWTGDIFPNYVCNGPFILKDKELKSSITLEKSPTYTGTNPARSDRLHFSVIEDAQTAYNMFQEGSLDWYGDTCGTMSLETVYDLNRKGSLIKKFSGGAQWLVCNVATPHLASAKIRQALAWSVDRQEICDKLLQGGETPSHSIVLKSMSQLKEQPFGHNPVLARQLFEEGMAELGYTRETYPPIVITHHSDPTVKAFLEAEQQQIQNALGITVELLPIDWGTYAKRMLPPAGYEILSMLWFTFYQDPMYNLGYIKYRGQGINSTNWENSDYIAFLDKADRTIDPVERNGYLQQAELILAKELPIIPVFYHTFKYAKAPFLAGEALSGAGQMELRWLEKTAVG